MWIDEEVISNPKQRIVGRVSLKKTLPKNCLEVHFSYSSYYVFLAFLSWLRQQSSIFMITSLNIYELLGIHY